jgi:hypothetical protein
LNQTLSVFTAGEDATAAISHLARRTLTTLHFASALRPGTVPVASRCTTRDTSAPDGPFGTVPPLAPLLPLPRLHPASSPASTTPIATLRHIPLRRYTAACASTTAHHHALPGVAMKLRGAAVDVDRPADHTIANR